MPKFPTTRDFLITKAGLDGAARRHAVSSLLSRYWGPMFTHLRVTTKLSHQQAEQMVHSFLADVLLRRDWMDKVDCSTGRFRDLLRHCLDEYVSVQLGGQLPPVGESEAAVSSRFDQAWTLDVVAELVRRLRDDCVAKDNPQRWELVRLRVLEPILSGTPPASDLELAERLGLGAETTVASEMRYVRRQSGVLLRSLIEEYALPSPELRSGLYQLVPPGTPVAREPIGTGVALEDGVREQAEGLIESTIDEELNHFLLVLSRGRADASRRRAASPALREFLERRLADPTNGLRSTDVATLFDAPQPHDEAVAWQLVQALQEAPRPGQAEVELLAAGLQKILCTPVRHERARVDIHCLADLLEHPRPPVDVLTDAKDWARSCRLGAGRSVGAAFATVIYYACIAAALTRCGKKITGLDPPVLVSGFEWAMQQAWLDEQLWRLFNQARQVLLRA